MKEDKSVEEKRQKAIENKPHTAEDLSVNADKQVSKPDEANTSEANGRDFHDVPKLTHSEGQSTIARDNDSDNANGLLRFNDNKDEDKPEVTEKFMDETVKKNDK